MFRPNVVARMVVYGVILIAFCVSVSVAGTRQYFDKNGKRITEEEYRNLTGHKKAPSAKSVNPSPKTTQPAPAAVKPVVAQKSDADRSYQEEDEDEDSGGYGSSLDLVSETILRVFERDTLKEDNAPVVPIYQYLTLDYGRSKAKGFTAHFQGWGRLDAADSEFYEDQLEGALLHAYIQYADPDHGYIVKAGRHHIFKGVSNASIDGLWGETFISPYFTASAYGGLPVGFEDLNGRSGDGVYGGRAANLVEGLYEIGASYKRLDNDSEVVEERLGLDLFLRMANFARFSGYSTYNLQTEDWAEHAYELQFNFSEVYLRVNYDRFSYADYFIDDEINSSIFGFLRDSGEVLSVIGGDVNLRSFGFIDLGAALRYYDYDIRTDAALYAAGLLKGYVGYATEVGAELGYMNGETPETRYLLSRAYYYWDMSSGFLSGDVVYVKYEEDVFGKDRSVYVSLSGGVNLYSDSLQLKLSGDYSDDPYFDSDIRGMLVLLFIL